MKLFSQTFLIPIILLATPGLVPAQDAPAPPPPFCETHEGFNQWDFWVGEWNVYANNEARQFAGTNSITKHHYNCLIKEAWTNAGGSGGFSVNYFNPVKDEWRQVWVANGYSIDYTGGLNDDGAMELTGHIFTYSSGASQQFKGIWTPESNGDVIQRFEIHNAETDEWSVWFEGRYVRQETDPNPPEATE